MPVNFRDYRFFDTHTEAMMQALQVRFYESPDRLGKLSHYLPLSRLGQLIDSLILGEYDGLKICYGQQLNPDNGYQSYELVLTEVQLIPPPPGSTQYGDIRGKVYLSTEDFADPATPQGGGAGSPGDDLKHTFQAAPGRNGTVQTGSFIGLNQLREFYDARRDGFDGLEIWYGLDQPKWPNAVGQFVLMVRLVKWGSVYVSISDTSTEPTGVGCPPLTCNA